MLRLLDSVQQRRVEISRVGPKPITDKYRFTVAASPRTEVGGRNAPSGVNWHLCALDGWIEVELNSKAAPCGRGLGLLAFFALPPVVLGIMSLARPSKIWHEHAADGFSTVIAAGSSLPVYT